MPSMPAKLVEHKATTGSPTEALLVAFDGKADRRHIHRQAGDIPCGRAAYTERASIKFDAFVLTTPVALSLSCHVAANIALSVQRFSFGADAPAVGINIGPFCRLSIGYSAGISTGHGCQIENTARRRAMAALF